MHKSNCKKTAAIFLVMMAAFLLPAEQTSAKSKDGAIKIVSQADGLHITKQHAAKFIYVTIHVRSDDGDCCSSRCKWYVR